MEVLRYVCEKGILRQTLLAAAAAAYLVLYNYRCSTVPGTTLLAMLLSTTSSPVGLFEKLAAINRSPEKSEL